MALVAWSTMTRKHQTPEYQRNARIIRRRVNVEHAAGRPVPCWRCRTAIHPGQAFDVGHLPGAQGSSLEELAPEHRSKTTHCKGNRSHGGSIGAAITNARAQSTVSTRVQTWRL